jgi:hypothetical protein
MAQVAQISQTAPVPPQNLEAEESVLGAMMLSPGAIGAVSEILDGGDFYRESHARIYRAALGLYARGEPVDAITLVDELEERGELEEAGGRVRIHERSAGSSAPAARSPGSAGSGRARPTTSSTGPSRSSSTSRRTGSHPSSAISRPCSRRASSGSPRSTRPAPR